MSSSAADNFTVIDLDNSALADRKDSASTSRPEPTSAATGDGEVFVTAEDTDVLPLWIARTYLFVACATVLISFVVAILAGLAARRLYLLAYKMGTVPEPGPGRPPEHGKPEPPRPIEPRHRDIFMSFLVYSPCVVVSYALMVTVGIPAFSAVRVKNHMSLSVIVQTQLRALKKPNFIWLGILSVFMLAATVAFFIAPGHQWPRAFGVAPLLALLTTTVLMGLTWRM